MEKVYQELEEAKKEIEELKKRLQMISSEPNQRSETEQQKIVEFQDAGKQNQELTEKAGEIFMTKELDEEVKYNMADKESAITHLNYAIDNLRLDYDEKLKRCEEEHSGLLVALDDVNARIKDKENKIKDLECENERLKKLLSVKDKECDLQGNNAHAPEEQMRQRYGSFEETEDEKRKVEEQLKFRTEEFKFLEETHERLQEMLYASKSQWEIEKLLLLDEVSIMQTSLESHGKIKSCGLDPRDEIIDKLKDKLETWHCLMNELKLQNEELSNMFQLLKSKFTVELQSTHAHEEPDRDFHGKEKESSIIALMEKLETKNAALIESHNEIERQHENASSLFKKLQDLNGIQEQQQHALQKHQKVMEESTVSPNKFKGQDENVETKLEQELQAVCDALERVNSELDEQLYDGSATELELQIWKCTAEQLKLQLEGNQSLRTQLESSLLEQAEFEEVLKQDIDHLKQISDDKDRRIDYLHAQIALLDKGITINKEETTNSMDNNISEAEENYAKSHDADEIELLEQEALRRELESTILAQIRAERTIEQVMTLSGDSENLLAFIEGLCSMISKLSSEDTTSQVMLGKILHTIGNEIGIDFSQGYERCPAKESVNLTIYPMTKQCEVAVNEN